MTDVKAGKFCKNCRHIGYTIGASYPRCEKIVAVPFSWDYQPDAYELPMYEPVDCDTFEPVTPPGQPRPLPPIDMIRDAAREVGYAVGVHGSQARDFDLIAAPWTDEAVGNHALIKHLCSRLTMNMGRNVVMRSLERKPHGRYACILKVDGDFCDIDLSITPKTERDGHADR